MEYLLVMSLSGSTMMGIHILCRCLLKDKISARMQYLHIRVAVLFYLVPLPLLKRWYSSIYIHILPMKKIKVVQIVPGSSSYAVYANGTMHYNNYMKVQIVLLVAWLLISVALMLFEIVDYLRTSRKFIIYMNNKMTLAEGEYIEKVKKSCRLKQNITVYQGIEEGTMTFGFFRPVILLGRKVGDKEAELILQHEMIHIKRRDVLWKILQRFVFFLYWWNPMVWILRCDFERVCEWSCDEEVVQGRTKEEVKIYLHLMIDESKTEGYKKNSHVQWGIRLGNTAKKLLERMENVMKIKRWNKIVAGSVMAVLVLANSLTVLAYSDVTYDIKEESVSQAEIEESMNADVRVFIPDEVGKEQLVDGVLYTMGDIDIRYEEQFVDEMGNIYQLQNEMSASTYSLCNHDYVTGTLSEHTKNSSGGCTVKVFSAKRCSKCGVTSVGSKINEITYAVCPH